MSSTYGSEDDDQKAQDYKQGVGSDIDWDAIEKFADELSDGLLVGLGTDIIHCP